MELIVLLYNSFFRNLCSVKNILFLLAVFNVNIGGSLDSFSSVPTSDLAA